MQRINRRNVLAGLFWLGISVFVMVESVKSDIGSLHAPGPGFLPFWSAVLLGIFSAILLIMNTVKSNLQSGSLLDLWKGLNWSRVLLILIVLFLYPLLLPMAGYLIATFAFILFLLIIGERSKLWIDVASALAITLISYLIFYVLLDVKLPKGIIGL